MNKDLWDLLFYYDKLYVALNATVSSGLLWIHQEDLEGHPWTFCAYPSEMSQIAQNTNWCGQCDQQAFTLGDSSGLFMLGPGVMGHIKSNSEV